MHPYLIGRILSSGFVNDREFSLHLNNTEVNYLTQVFYQDGVQYSKKRHNHKKHITIVNIKDPAFHKRFFSDNFITYEQWVFVPKVYATDLLSIIDLSKYSKTEFSHFIRGVFEGCGRYLFGKNVSCVFYHNMSFLQKLNSILFEKLSMQGDLIFKGDNNDSHLCFHGINLLDLLYHVYSFDNHKYYNPQYFHYYNLVCSWKSKNLVFKYKKTQKEALPPSKIRASDSGYDLTILSKVKEVNGVEFFDTGIIVEPPLGYYFDLVPRSSLSKTGYMLANSVGIIDRGYRSNLLVPLVKICKDAPDLSLPFRAVQIIPRRICHLRSVEVDSFDETHRGEGGFGSTNR